MDNAKPNPEDLSINDLIKSVIGKSISIEECGGLACIAKSTIFQLAEHTTPAIAYRLAAAIELGRRAVQAAASEAMPRLPDKDAVIRWAQGHIAMLDHEELWVLSLDGRHGLRAARQIAKGGVHGLHVGVRDVLRAVVKDAASAFVMTHNHPSADPTPSEEDVAFTRAVVSGASLVGTPLLDHVIVARSRASSMLDLGLL